MKKQYEIPAVEVTEIAMEALLEASLPLLDDDATAPGMSRETDNLEEAAGLPKFIFE